MEIVNAIGRDNSRTPLQWSDEPNGGFSTVNPWMKINPNYQEVNVMKQQKDEDSVLNFYKKMLKIRKELKSVLVYGKIGFHLIDDPNLFIFERQHEDQRVLIICSFSSEI